MAIDWTERGGVVKSASDYDQQKSWLQLGASEALAVSELFKIIESSLFGKELLAKAKLKASKDHRNLKDVVLAGEVSLTDTTLIRKFSSSDPFAVSFKAESKIYIQKSLDVKNAVLDLVHELTHFTYKEDFNPYKENFSLISFIQDTIEGRGGELDAFLVECRIGKSLFGNNISSQCDNVVKGSEFSRELAKAEFYKIGNFYDKFHSELAKFRISADKFPLISPDNGLLVSSAWSRPYPLAIIEEYKNIMGRVCENDLKRISVLSSGVSRFPASDQKSFLKIRSSIISRCADVIE